MSEPSASQSGLGATAYWTASVRALESACQEPLFQDPWAELLAGEVGRLWIAQRTPASILPIILRTRFFDDFLLRVVSGQAVRQVVLLAAGLDTRAYRLAWPAGISLFELDQPEVLAYKAELLQTAGASPACLRQAIGIDLTSPWPGGLLQAGYDPGQPSAWLLEGFLFYLPSEQVAHILEDVTSMVSEGSWLGFDIINRFVLTHPFTRPWVEMQAAAGAPWIGTLDDPQGFLGGRGWQVSLSQAGEPEANFGRWPYPVVPPALPDFPHNWYVTAQFVKAEPGV
ncbi:MAG: SAM-dependent methyltransferase [Anaerolineales bacterium]|nr:SAM-dependent methyltransferase [Anaerolineales bacterium]